MRPFVTVNCAMSADGKIALPSREQTRISSDEDLRRVHRLRNSSDGILVGIETVLGDDPSLLVKPELMIPPPAKASGVSRISPLAFHPGAEAPGVQAKSVKRVHQPLRIVLDSRCRVPARAKVVLPPHRTLIATAGKAGRGDLGANVELFSTGAGPRVRLRTLLEELGRRGLKSIMVEGGEEVIGAFLREGLVDRLLIYVGNLVIGGKGPTPAGGVGARRLEDCPRLELRRARRLGGGVLLEWRPLTPAPAGKGAAPGPVGS